MKLRISRQGIELETKPLAVSDWAKPSLLFAWPGELYRIVARRKIAALIAENRRLRRAGYGGKDPRPLVRLFEWAFMAWLDRRYPVPPAPPIPSSPGVYDWTGTTIVRVDEGQE